MRFPDAIHGAAIAALTVFVFGIGSAAVAARPDTIRPGEIDLTEVAVRIHWLESVAELRRILREFKLIRPSDELPRGFSVMRQHTATGAWICDIYVFRPQRVNDSRTLSLGHEMLHCLTGDYHVE